MRLPDLLATKTGRMAAFFSLYLTEGIPLGFTAVAIATQMRRQGLGPAEIGAFVASLYLPWSLKWAFGPFVDVLSSERWGRRRMWIVGAQVAMVATLLAAMPVDYVANLKLFTALIFVHNVFGATQDVAIDALACSILKPEERGLANGLMFGGAYLGQAVGGSAVLYLTSYVPFQTTFLFVAAWILAVTVFVAVPLREPKGEPRPPRVGSALAAVGREIAGFARQAARAMFGTFPAAAGFALALLPAGAYALGLALQSNLAVELGMSDASVAAINLWSTILSAAGCVAGGWLSDRVGRHLALSVYVAAMSIPTVYLAWSLQHHRWILPVDPKAPDRPPVPPELLTAYWVAVLSYAVFNGLMYGTRSALFMDVTSPAVAATQFTAYMALLNFAISYSAKWQGWAAERWGYPKTLLGDAALGLVCLFVIPLVRPRRAPAPAPAAT